MSFQLVVSLPYGRLCKPQLLSDQAEAWVVLTPLTLLFQPRSVSL